MVALEDKNRGREYRTRIEDKNRGQWNFAIIRSTEQSRYEFLRSFARLNNLDMICCDHSLDWTIWIWFVAIIRSTEHRDMNFGQKLVKKHRFCFDFVLAWGHYWIIFGYTGSHFSNIRCWIRQLFEIWQKNSLNIFCKIGSSSQLDWQNRWRNRLWFGKMSTIV